MTSPRASESPVEAAPQKREADFSAAFGGIQGCAVLYDPGTDQWTFYQEEMCRQRVSPCSTFKIVSTLMGLHTGVLSGPESTMTYSGLTYPVAAWNQNLTLEQAFQSSCVWYFRQVIDQVGRQAGGGAAGGTFLRQPGHLPMGGQRPESEPGAQVFGLTPP